MRKIYARNAKSKQPQTCLALTLFFTLAIITPSYAIAQTKNVEVSAPQTPPDAVDAAASRPERGRWMAGLSPEQIDKVKAMSPDERRAWIRQQRQIVSDPATR